MSIPRLTDAEVSALLSAHPEWALRADGKALERELRFADFTKPMDETKRQAVLAALAEVAGLARLARAAGLPLAAGLLASAGLAAAAAATAATGVTGLRPQASKAQ